MANNCLFDAKITGKKTNVQELLDLMCKHEIGRIFSCEYDDYDLEVANDDDIISVMAYGDCAWSVLCAMLSEYVNPSLETETKRLNLVIEIYSTESGMGFQEHYLIDRGNKLIDECKDDYEEYWPQDYDSTEEFNEDNDTNFTEDMIDENGDIIIGGFGDRYGIYQSFDAKHFEQ